MLIGSQGTIGTIGGGHLEWQAIPVRARSARWQRPRRRCSTHSALVLGTQLGQCCGGVVELWIERFTRRDLPLLRSAAQAARDTRAGIDGDGARAGGVTRRVMGADDAGVSAAAASIFCGCTACSDAEQRVRSIAGWGRGR